MWVYIHEDLLDDISTLSEVMTCCHLETQSHFFDQHRPRSMMTYGTNKPQWFNTLRPRQNGRHFADAIFKCIFFNENIWIFIKISLKFVPRGPINNIPSLVQIMAWRRPGDKPLSEPMMVSLPTHICVTRPQWVKWNKLQPLDFNKKNHGSTIIVISNNNHTHCQLQWIRNDPHFDGEVPDCFSRANTLSQWFNYPGVKIWIYIVSFSDIEMAQVVYWK